MHNSFNLKGTIHLELFDADGRLKASRRVENVVTNTGRQLVIDRLQSGAVAVADYVAIGTDGTGAVPANTQLGAETARGQGTLSQPDAYTDRCVHTFAAGVGTGTIVEAGRLNAAESGTLMGRQTFTAVEKTANDSLQITYDFTYAAG